MIIKFELPVDKRKVSRINIQLNAPIFLFVLFELKSLGESASDNRVRQAGQLGRVEPMGLGTGSIHQLVEEWNGFLCDILVPLVLHHAGHVGGEHVLSLLQVKVVVVSSEKGSTTAFSQGCDDRTGDSRSI